MPEVDVDEYVATRSVGGLGIHLIRNYMDEVDYQRTNGQNVLTMKKNLKTTTNNKNNGSNNQKG
jgi:anti-sigma regulatory factor (Ser/Thr protein kinase)